jgi:integrase/recombinase XerD
MLVVRQILTPAQLVSSYLDHLAVERAVATNTLVSYRRDLQRYLQFLQSCGVADFRVVDASIVSGFLGYLREGDPEHLPLSAPSAARAVIAVRGLHKFALREQMVDVDVAREVKPTTPRRRLPKAISVEDVERLLDSAGYAGTPAALRDRALLEVLYGTGARISEAVGLAVDEVDLSERTWMLRG